MKKSLIHLSLIAALFTTSCNSESHEKKTEHTTYSVTSPLVKDTTTLQEYVCQIRSIQHIELRALEKGYLKDIYVDEGQYIKKGQLMFQIMPKLYKAEAKKAEAEAQFAKIEYLNTKALADSNIVSQNELALAKATYDQALAELELANVHLGFTEIRAPFTGMMGRFNVRQGSLLDEGELLTELSDNSKVWVYFNVSEAEYLNYSTKIDKNNLQKVHLQMANNKIFNHQGEIETIEADFNNETGNIAFRATFPNPEGLLRHGETGNILIPTDFKDALIIPQKATFEILDKKYVYVVGDDNVVRSKSITIEKELAHIYIVKSGLTKDDKILIDGLRTIKGGDKISYKKIAPPEVISNLNLYAE
ncbi:efflux RND transporter periplasmic adaptor subunit [Brumimicrobium mesophilum]|uniref:efflux RND transporter periplasmic adaptor subunit n=1 Tax=Brumimicrobium mesophilum TaxID=392717 RepID=UPI000D1443EB|nr:efflux RND transporter periplasmic adaptor subunit [Brumimicrobium mesophilum]